MKCAKNRVISTTVKTIQRKRFYFMLQFLDNILLSIWHIIKYALLLLWNIIEGVSLLIKPLFKLQRLRSVAKFAKYIRELKTVKATASIPQYFNKKMEDSKIFRRIAFPATAILLILYLYPPSHWGPWYKYQTGTASYYSSGFCFRKTANGNTFMPFFYTAAHKTLPLGITAKVVNCENGKTVYVKIDDRGPFAKGRILDLSSAAAKKIGLFRKGTGKVTIYTKKRYKK